MNGKATGQVLVRWADIKGLRPRPGPGDPATLAALQAALPTRKLMGPFFPIVVSVQDASKQPAGGGTINAFPTCGDDGNVHVIIYAEDEAAGQTILIADVDTGYKC